MEEDEVVMNLFFLLFLNFKIYLEVIMCQINK